MPETWFQAATGCDYNEAATHMAAAGLRPGHGCHVEVAAKAFTDIGFGFTATGHSLDSARTASRTGRVFYVTAQTRNSGHAWVITDGASRGAWNRQSFHYRIFEVTA